MSDEIDDETNRTFYKQSPHHPAWMPRKLKPYKGEPTEKMLADAQAELDRIGFDADRFKESMKLVGEAAATAMYQFAEAVRQLGQDPTFQEVMRQLAEEEDLQESYGYSVIGDEEE
jgi:hypothetical protein